MKTPPVPVLWGQEHSSWHRECPRLSCLRLSPHMQSAGRAPGHRCDCFFHARTPSSPNPGAGGVSSPQRPCHPLSSHGSGAVPASGRGWADVPPPVSPAWRWRLHFQEHFQLLSLGIRKCQCCTNGLCGSGPAVAPLSLGSAQLERSVWHHSTRTGHCHHCLPPPTAHKLQSCPTGSKNHGQGTDRLAKSRSTASTSLQESVCPAV